MKSKDQEMNEQQAFDDLAGNDRFDDSVDDQHKSDLRAKLLQSFGAPASDPSIVELHRDAADQPLRTRQMRYLGLGVVLAACLMGLVAAWIYSNSVAGDRNFVKKMPVHEASLDDRLVALLEEVNEFDGDVSPDALFNAIAMCELEHEGRERFDSLQP